MKDKEKQTEPFVYVNARIWTGVDIEGQLAIPRQEFIERWMECYDAEYFDRRTNV